MRVCVCVCIYILIVRRNLCTRTQCDPYRYRIFFTYSFVHGDLGWFHKLAIVNNAVINKRMQISLKDTDFISFGYIPRIGDPVSRGSFIYFIFWGPSILLFHKTVPIYIHFYLLLLFFLFYNTLLVLPYIDMNPPRVYMSSQSWTPSHHPPHIISLGHPSAPAPNILYPVSSLD